MTEAEKDLSLWPSPEQAVLMDSGIRIGFDCKRS